MKVFYILNFGDHSFVSCSTPKEVGKAVSAQLARGAKPCTIAVINACSDGVHLSLDEFYAEFADDLR